MKKIHEMIIYVVGLNFIALGICISINTGLGGSFWDTLIFSLEHITEVSAGLWLFILGVLLTIIIEFLNSNFKLNQRKILKMILTIFSGLLVGIFIDFWNPITYEIFNDLSSVIGIIGIMITGFGIALYSQTKMPIDPIDNFMIGLVNYKKISMIKSRYLTDFIALTIIFILGLTLINFKVMLEYGYIGFGNIIVFLFLSPSISYFNKKLSFINVYFNSK